MRQGGADHSPKWRTIMEGLILAALVWTGGSLTKLQTQMASVNTEIVNLRTQLEGVPALRERVSRLEGRLAASERRIREVSEQ